MSGFGRELWFLWRDRAAKVWLLIGFAAASLAVVFGLMEMDAQRDTIERLKAADEIERTVTTEGHRDDWGSVAYYTFHLTYDPPEEFAFAALGQRDASPWKHRIRMLALEGQIHETDAANPDFALIGRFDFAFVAAMLAPLILIMLLHDLRSGERSSGRYDLLSVTSADPRMLWFSRAAWRVGALALVLLVPLWIAGVSGAGASKLLGASLALLAHLLFWWAVIAWVNTRTWTSTVNLTALIGLWLAFAVVAPAAIKAGVDAAITVPEGGDIMLTQREAVNDAWDLPKEATMTPFIERHPEMAQYAEIPEGAFQWKWYYAFQQVGDQVAEPLSVAYREGRARRDALAGLFSWLSPPAKLERALQRMAGTDAAAALRYEDKVRAFHADLRAYYYPPMFKDEPVTDAVLAERPSFE